MNRLDPTLGLAMSGLAMAAGTAFLARANSPLDLVLAVLTMVLGALGVAGSVARHRDWPSDGGPSAR